MKIGRRTAPLLLALLMVLALPCAVAGQDETRVAPKTFSDFFPDPIFAKMVAGQLEREPTQAVTRQELGTVTRIQSPSFDQGLQSLEGIRYLTGLEEMEMDFNPNLLELPQEMATLKNLTTVFFRSGHFEEFPLVLTELEQLESLTLNSCRFSSVPPEIGRLQNLHTLSLCHGSGANLPEEIGQLENLRHLHLFDNHNLRSLPEGLYELTALETLDLSSTNVLITPDIGRLTGLRTLDLSNMSNFVTQSFPEEIGQLPSLTWLDLGMNRLDHVPEFIRGMNQLEYLSVTYNKNISKIPDWIGELTELRTLDVSVNQLSTLPDSLSNLQKLQKLDITANNFTQLPDSVFDLAQLEVLWLSSNQITDLTPRIGELTNLRKLNIFMNPIASLPLEICRLGQLESVDAFFWETDISFATLPAEIQEFFVQNEMYNPYSVYGDSPYRYE